MKFLSAEIPIIPTIKNLVLKFDHFPIIDYSPFARRNQILKFKGAFRGDDT